MNHEEALKTAKQIVVRQKREMAEFFGFETRNKYSIETPEGTQLFYAAEQQKGMLGFLLRQWLGHWRRFEVQIFDAERRPYLTARHPFRFYFQRLEVTDADGTAVGAIQQRFSILSKKFDVENAFGQVQMTVNSPLFRIWTFPFMRNGVEAARIEKKWGGILKESFLDADSFLITFGQPDMPLEERKLIMAASIFVDLQYFEDKSG
jgi:uncharacterized protein YxjI